MIAGNDPSISAADPFRSAWVAANAGSGKTYTLANRVTRLLLEGAEPARILCLTFTKAASAEMQSRLFGVLGELAMLPDDTLYERLVDITGERDASFDLAMARRMFALALETPGGLKIQTIHAFCQGVLSRFPLEAGIPPGFRVLDEQTAGALLTEARDRVLERAGAGDPLLRTALARLLTQVSEMRMNDILRNALTTDRRKLERFLGSLGTDDDELGHAMWRAHGVPEGETEGAILASFCAMADAEADRLQSAVRWMQRGAASDKKRAGRLANALALEIPRLAFPAFRGALLAANGDKYDRLVTTGLAKSDPTLVSYLEDFVERLCQAEARRRAAYAAEMGHATLVIARAVLEIYSNAKRTRGVLDYDDLIVGTRKLLENADASQWVLFKLDGGLDHILVDEAQDTSPEQWAIVSKLSEEFFVGRSARDETLVRTIFAVGDEKQSIFSFQGAEPALFERYGEYFRERVVAADLEFVSQPLVTSRRSAPEILEFVDSVFSGGAARDGLSTAGRPVAHLAHRRDAKGRVEFWPALMPTAEPEPDPFREVDLPSEISPIVRLAKRIADEIRGWLDNQVSLPSHPERPITPGDIMILLPRRAPFAVPIMRALKDRFIAVAGADRMHLVEQIAVQDLVALGRFAILPEDDLTTATLLRSPFCTVDEESLLELCHGRSRTLWWELSRRRSERPEYAEAHEFLADMLGRADLVPPFEFFAHALSARGMRNRFLARLGMDAGETIDEFLSLALQFEAENAPSLGGFLHWIERGGAEIKRDMERSRNEVRVMTVHGAKGLEAEIVILPDTTTLPQLPAQKGHLLYDGDKVLFPVAEALHSPNVAAAKQAAQEAMMREHRRLFYVALTRAKDRLYICGAANKQGIRNGSWYRLAESAAITLGTEVPRFGGTIRVFGDLEECNAPRAEPPPRREPLPDWISRSLGTETLRQPELRPSTAVDTFKGTEAGTGIGARDTSRRRGNLIHTLLARLAGLPANDRRTTAERYLRSESVADEDVATITKETLALLEDPRFAPAFSVNSRAEVPIAAELPEIGAGVRIEGRIDRLVCSDDEVLILDFKTDRDPPRTEDEVGSAYIAQMALYRAAIARIFPQRRVVCALLWTSGPYAMPLSDGLLDREFAAIRSRLDLREHRP
jgi:ATP-dependent helicase/nuclease subunit A